MHNPATDWMFATEPDPSINGRVGMWNAGRGLGGGSAINGMVYIRGDRHDYDDWAAAGCTGWSWDEVLPYFKRSEDWQGRRRRRTARAGRCRSRRCHQARPDRRLRAGLRRGPACARSTTIAPADVDGVFVNYATQRNGERWSAARGYLEAGPCRGRT